MAKKNLKMDLSPSNLVACLVYAVIGILLIALKGGSLSYLMTAVGALLIILGVVDIINGKDLIKGIVEIAIGVAVIALGWLLVDIVLLVFGVLLIVKGVLELIKIYKKGFMAMLPSLVTIVIGILLVVSKWALLDVICIIAGIVFIVNAVLTLFGKKLA